MPKTYDVLITKHDGVIVVDSMNPESAPKLTDIESLGMVTLRAKMNHPAYQGERGDILRLAIQYLQDAIPGDTWRNVRPGCEAHQGFTLCDNDTEPGSAYCETHRASWGD
jgi:hypothetical protein